MEERLARVEGVLEQVRDQLNHMETRMANLEGRLVTTFISIMGTLVVAWVSIILTVLFKG